jgi:hypothetical protein
VPVEFRFDKRTWLKECEIDPDGPVIASWHGISLQSEPTQCRHFPRPKPLRSGRLPDGVRSGLSHSGANATCQRVLSVFGIGPANLTAWTWKRTPSEQRQFGFDSRGIHSHGDFEAVFHIGDHHVVREWRLPSVRRSLESRQMKMRRLIEVVLGVLDRGGQGPCRIQATSRPRPVRSPAAGGSIRQSRFPPAARSLDRAEQKRLAIH